MSLTILAMIVQLFRIQIVDHQKYQAMAKEEQVKSLILPAKRGQIYASDGQNVSSLVLNETVYDLFADPQVISKKNRSKIIKTLNKYASANLVDGYQKLLAKKETRYQILAKKLTRKQAEKIKKKDFYGLGFTAYSQRVYPEGDLAAQVLGFVNNEGVGQYGVEQALNQRLTGKDGYLKTVTDVSNVPLTIGDEWVSVEPQDGDDLVLTIDRNIQYQAGKILAKHAQKTGAKEGSIVVMNPNNGQVMAMVNYPSFDPANFYQIEDIKLFNNSVVDQPYESGSVIKTFTTAMGLNEQVITPTASYYNNDCVMVYDRRICNVVRGLNHRLTFQEALNSSLNTGMIEIVKKMGSGRISKAARQKMYNYFNDNFRFGSPTGVELPEVNRRIISPDEQEGNAVRYSNMSFGQGFSVTMIQTASAFSAIANGGTYYQPTIIRGVLMDDGSIKANPPKIVKKQIISKTASDQLRQMVAASRGKYYQNLDPAGFVIGGKTGTSETLVDGKYNNQRTTASYLGFGGNTKQLKYVIMVRLADSPQQTLYGYRHAAPVFTDLSNWLINYLKLQPKE